MGFMPQLFTFAQAAELCGVSTRSMSRAVESGEIRATQAPGTRGVKGRRIAEDDLLSWLEAQRKHRSELTRRIKDPRGRGASQSQ